MATFFKDYKVTILVNPSATRLASMLEKSTYGAVRGVVDAEGDLYVWDAYHMVHSDLLFEFGIEGLRLDISKGDVRAVLAGGALELMVPDDNLQDFFVRHGHAGASLEDRGILAAICDKAIGQMRGHPSLKAYPPAAFDADIDPRQEHGLRTLAAVTEWHEAAAVRSR